MRCIRVINKWFVDNSKNKKRKKDIVKKIGALLAVVCLQSHFAVAAVKVAVDKDLEKVSSYICAGESAPDFEIVNTGNILNGTHDAKINFTEQISDENFIDIQLGLKLVAVENSFSLKKLKYKSFYDSHVLEIIESVDYSEDFNCGRRACNPTTKKSINAKLVITDKKESKTYFYECLQN